MPESHVGVLGGSSFLGKRALPLLVQAGCQVSVCTRREPLPSSTQIEWCHAEDWQGLELDALLSFAPIWVLPGYLERLNTSKLKRIVALSSTSRYIKAQSPDSQERALAQRLISAEDYVQNWALARGVDWVILRPTMIYGLALDKNITEVARLIRRLGFFPLMGGGTGLRQPVHIDDVVQACITALAPEAKSGAYNLSGGETLTYRSMVARIFQAQGLPERTLHFPSEFLRFAIFVMRGLPRYRHLSPALVTRMNQDLVFDHLDATLHLRFSPRPFHLSEQDLSRSEPLS
ncbi:NAD-dependent epimerase/dehydratase family protein [Pseudomonas sp. FEN]|uniref:NAD-dependent epimerase/dehydratase family protein n=1 Tax=Pseudomonas sp. FEN TaxID=2767468 RepID=UPI00174A9421|nr:NAD-dependent epimerase/dehydratase family protein [Pseudomonas sp. FEN]